MARKEYVHTTVEVQTGSIIFLDVDGVLTMSRCVCCDFYESDPTLLFPEDITALNGVLFDGCIPLERAQLENLKWLVEQSNSNIVLSTTWRQVSDMRAYLIAALEHIGIPSYRILDDTPCMPHLGRGGEIHTWVNEHKDQVSRYVVIDDDHVDSILQFVGADKFVQTTLQSAVGDYEEEGLTRERAERALEILMRQQQKQDA